LPLKKYVTWPNFWVSEHANVRRPAAHEVLADGAVDGRRRDEEAPGTCRSPSYSIMPA
jgi:hypothetical protein